MTFTAWGKEREDRKPSDCVRACFVRFLGATTLDPRPQTVVKIVEIVSWSVVLVLLTKSRDCNIFFGANVYQTHSQ